MYYTTKLKMFIMNAENTYDYSSLCSFKDTMNKHGVFNVGEEGAGKFEIHTYLKRVL